MPGRVFQDSAASYPPPARCSRPASRRSSPKHCVQQQFPIACRPAPPFLLQPLSASPGGAAASAPAGARQTATEGTKAAAKPAGSRLPLREGRARGRGVPGHQPSAWPACHLPAPITAPAATGGPCRHAPCHSCAPIGHASGGPISGGWRVRHFRWLSDWLSQLSRRHCSWL